MNDKERRAVTTLSLLGVAMLLSSLPFLGDRYSFLLDQIFGPGRTEFQLVLYGFEVPVYGGFLPFRAFESVFGGLLGVGFAQKLFLVGILASVLLIGYRVLPVGPGVAIYVLLLAVNPFTYARAAVGHFLVIWGLAMLTLSLYSFARYLDHGNHENLLFSVVAVTLLGFSSHLLLAGGILLGFVAGFKYLETRETAIIGRTVAVPAVAIPVNAYWLGPVFLSGIQGISKVTTADQHVYAPQTDVFTALYSTASMHGFWRGGITYATDIFPPIALLFVPILYLAVHGFLTNYDHPERGYVVKALGATWLVALLLGSGVNGPAAPLYSWLFENVPFFAGMRDSNKFVALIVLAYAYLGALGLDDLLDSVPEFTLDRFRDALTDLRSSVAHHESLAATPELRTLAAWTLALFLLLTPVLYTFPMVTGYASQIEAQDYPEEWYETKQYVDDPAREDGAVLFLPWHQYMDYHWVAGSQQRIATPARAFFERPVIQGDNVEAGPVYSTSTNPVSKYVEFVFGLGPDYDPRTNVTNVGELLAHVDVEYVVVTKEADWRAYDAVLRNQTDLRLAMENDMFRVYRNEYDVSRAYAVDEVRYVADREAFLERSRTENTTEAVYVIDERYAGQTTKLGDRPRAPVDAREIHPARYEIDATDRRLTAFAQGQATYADDWRLDGREPAYRHLGFTPVYETSDGGTLRHAAFYEIYLPSYAVSLGSVTVLIGYYVVRRRRDREDDMDE